MWPLWPWAELLRRFWLACISLLVGELFFLNLFIFRLDQAASFLPCTLQVRSQLLVLEGGQLPWSLSFCFLRDCPLLLPLATVTLASLRVSSSEIFCRSDNDQLILRLCWSPAPLCVLPWVEVASGVRCLHLAVMLSWLTHAWSQDGNSTLWVSLHYRRMLAATVRMCGED